jgi:hypothetical protein
MAALPNARATVFLALIPLLAPSAGRSAGVTIITHGLNGNVDGWVLAMAGRMREYYRFPGATFTCYEIYFALTNSTYTPTWRRLDGPPPSAANSGEIVVKLDWRQLANNDYSTYQVAAAVAPRLLQTNFIAELNGHALAELPLHLIGHSRGGSLVCELSRLLGTNGVWVDHLTTLDPHPLNNDGFFDFPYTVVDASAQTYENVLFHDNYFQTLNFVFYGESVPGAYVRKLTNLDGGYGGAAASHSDVHLWYHGTVDLRVPADDSEATIGTAERQTWWTPAESSGLTAGFYYGLIGGGNRFSQSQPAGSGTGRIRDGYNQIWDLGAGTSNNRIFLPANNGNWPNVLRFNLAGTNLLAHGQSNTANIYVQWAKPASSNAVIGLYLDDDFNPYNGNERLAAEFNASGTTRNQVAFGALDFEVNAGNATPGEHSLFAVINGGGRSRYLYAPETVTVFTSFQPPRLAIATSTNSQVMVDVIGLPGQRVVLQDTADLRTWRSLTTNWLTTDRFRYSTNTSGAQARFYRAVLQ